MKIISKILLNGFVLVVIQMVIAYIGWNMTAVTIVSSSLNSIGLFMIILAIFLRDITKFLQWVGKKFGFNNN